MILTHGNIELLERQVNEALSHGWNILGYPNFLNGQWVQGITRVTDEKESDRNVE